MTLHHTMVRICSCYCTDKLVPSRYSLRMSGNPTFLRGCAPLTWTAGGVAGITSTPVIDPDTDTVYVMSYSVEGATVDSAAYRCTNTDSSVGCLASSGGC